MGFGGEEMTAIFVKLHHLLLVLFHTSADSPGTEAP